MDPVVIWKETGKVLNLDEICNEFGSGKDLSSYDVSNVPVIENINSKILEEVSKPGNELYMRDWHRCDTSHCIAGWAVHLAGKAGYELEKLFVPYEGVDACASAAALIFAASGVNPIPYFYGKNEEAMEALIERANQEKEAAP